MADLSEENVTEVTSDTGDNIPVENNGEKARNMKRSRTGMIGSSTENSEDSEPDEKRPAFRLQPPTLIHGKAKPVPKSEEDKANNSSKCKFLQPPRLSAPTGSAGAPSASKNEQSDIRTEPEPLVSSSNPFLHMVGKKEATEEKKENEVEQKSPVAINGSDQSESTQCDSSTEVTAKEEVSSNESKSENLFLQAAKNLSSEEPSSSGFLFGSNMEDRVTLNSDNKSPKKDSGDGASSSSAEFVFGQNLSERAKVSSSTDSTPNLFLPSSHVGTNQADSSSHGSNILEPSTQSPSISDKKTGLEEDASAHFLEGHARPIMPEVTVVTGEENEKNVLQLQCKLHQFEAKTQNWLERGVGNLHLNDGKCSGNDMLFQSRLVMRVHGSMRLVLNTKVWPQMIVEKASKKSVRISAQTEGGSIGVYLITATINDAEQIFRALEYRVLHQRQMEERRKETEKLDRSSYDENSQKNAVSNDDPQQPDEEKSKTLSESPVANIDTSPNAENESNTVSCGESKQATISSSDQDDLAASTLSTDCSTPSSATPS